VRASLLLALALALVGCSSEADPATESDAGDAGVGGSTGCPDPNDPRVHYVSDDPNDCTGITLDCTTDQNGFHNSCGCGCIDKGDPMCPAPTDPEITWISHDPAECPASAPSCPLGQNGFSNTCGCGCISY
jgi:hypothetical protein